MEKFSQRRQVHVTPRSLKRWTEVFEAAGGCVMTAMHRTGCTRPYVQCWKAEIYGAGKQGGPRIDLNQDQVDELTAAIHARIRQEDMAHRFGVTTRTLRNMIKRYGLPMLRAPRGSKKCPMSGSTSLQGKPW